MSKRIATPLEIKQIMAQPPWNAGKYKYGSDNEHVELPLECSKAVPLTIVLSTYMLIDRNNQPVAPFGNIAMPELARILKVPTITDDTPLYFGELSEEEVDSRIINMLSFRFETNVVPSKATHFMTVVKRSQSSYLRKTLNPKQSWTQIHLRDVLHDFDASRPTIAVMRAISELDSCDDYWEFTLYPIGYCWPEYDREQDGYWIEDERGAKSWASTPDDLIPDMAEITRRLREKALQDYEQQLEAEAEYVKTVLQPKCDEFADYVRYLHKFEGFKDFEAEFVPYTDGRRVLKNGSAICNADDIEEWLERLIREAKRYEKYRPKMEALRQRIQACYGELDTTSSTGYAEVSFKVHVFGTQDAGRVTQRFAYSEIGYMRLRQWLKEQEATLAEAQSWLEGHKE